MWTESRFFLFDHRCNGLGLSSGNLQLQYDEHSKAAFASYFIKPKRKRGRPKKRKRGRPKKKLEPSAGNKQTMLDSTNNDVIDLLTAKDKDDLDARLEGALRKCKRSGPVKRINWDAGDHAVFRKRCADSWLKGNDLFEKGESFNHFTKRMGIDRNVLKRYMKGKYITQSENTNRRGRPSLLPVSLMTHLCEGQFMHVCLFVCYYDKQFMRYLRYDIPLLRKLTVVFVVVK